MEYIVQHCYFCFTIMKRLRKEIQKWKTGLTYFTQKLAPFLGWGVASWVREGVGIGMEVYKHKYDIQSWCVLYKNLTLVQYKSQD